MLLMLWLAFSAVSCDKLVDLHIIFRHGERVPERAFPTDPWKDTWTDAPGEMTRNGQLQVFEQGLRMKRRYVDDLQYMDKNYLSRDLFVRSTSLNRTITSASIFMTAFFLESEDSAPPDPRWPKGYTPVPVRTMPFEEEFLLVPFDICERFKAMARARELHPSVTQLMTQERPFLEELARNAGLEIRDYSIFDEFWGFMDAVLIEAAMGLKRAEWITEGVWDRFIQNRNRVYAFVQGEAGFGEPENVQMTALGGGPFLKTLITDMDLKLAHLIQTKMHFYSAHDSTISFILRALGAKADVIGYNLPGFGCTLAFEVWADDEGSNYLQLQYWQDADSPMLTITKSVGGCPKADKCPFELFKKRVQPYFPKADIKKICLDTEKSFAPS